MPHDIEKEILPPNYHDQRTRVIQLLKDAGHPYSTEHSCNPAATIGTPEIPPEEVSDGYWNLTPESLRRAKDSTNPYIRSHLAIAAELRFMQTFHPLYHAAERVFLDDEVSDTNYDWLCKQADQESADRDEAIRVLRKKNASENNLIRTYINSRTPTMQLVDQVNIFIHDLTIRLKDETLHVVFPQQQIKRTAEEENTTKRRQDTEETYREIHRIFKSWCETISAQGHKRFRNRAYDATTFQVKESRATVERAVHFVESVPDDYQNQEEYVA